MGVLLQLKCSPGSQDSEFVSQHILINPQACKDPVPAPCSAKLEFVEMIFMRSWTDRLASFQRRIASAADRSRHMGFGSKIC